MSAHQVPDDGVPGHPLNMDASYTDTPTILSELLTSLRAMVAFHWGRDDDDYPELATARALLKRLEAGA